MIIIILYLWESVLISFHWKFHINTLQMSTQNICFHEKIKQMHRNMPLIQLCDTQSYLSLNKDKLMSDKSRCIKFSQVAVNLTW